MAGDDLERSLGLYPTMMISMGAMIGSGSFVLPALGYKKAGPAVIIAYVLAAVVVLPPALSKAEMATAMPESGGTYLSIDRALGPLFGTIAGIGLLTQMGTLPILGAVGIIAGALVIYLAYGRSRTDRTGAIGTIIRGRSTDAEDDAVPTTPD